MDDFLNFDEPDVDAILERCRVFLDITIYNRIDCGFTEWRKRLPAQGRGVYLIHDEQGLIYIGKGIVKVRTDKHEQKITDTRKHGQPEPQGWKWLRLVQKPDITKWKLTALYLDSKSGETALEGCLIHFLQPVVNEETFTGVFPPEMLLDDTVYQDNEGSI